MNPKGHSKLSTLSRYVTLESDEPQWWLKLTEPVPVEQMCQDDRCKFAPPGHKKHGPSGRNISVAEARLIIKYLVHYNLISSSKGMVVWEQMISRGYLSNRKPDSLRGYFKDKLLRDIECYKLPAELEARFTALRT